MIADQLQHTLRSDSVRIADQTARAAADRTDEFTQQLIELLDLILTVELSGDSRQAHQRLAAQMSAYLNMDFVAVGVLSGRAEVCRLQACSGSDRLEVDCAQTENIEAAMDEAVMRDGLTICPPRGDQRQHAALAHQNLCSAAGAAFVVSHPFRDGDGRVIGVLLAVALEPPDEPHSVARFVEMTAHRIGPCLETCQLQPRPPVRQKISSVWNRLTVRRKNALGIAALVLLAALVFPVPYKVRCNCELQPALRRFVAAPFDGTLERNLAEMGDVVCQGDVLARLDGREIRWELAGVTAEYERAAKDRDAAMAKQDTAGAQKAKLAMQRLELQRRLLEHRGETLNVVSPIAGLVINSALDDAEGAPLEVGQMLFEVAPLANMKFEIDIPEKEIMRVETGMPVTVRLEAFPGRTWRGWIERIHPRAEIRRDESVFVAEATFDNADGLLRPGMKGRATVAGRRGPLVWNVCCDWWGAACAAF
jgi:biotin carboxyl carrier protein